MTYYNDVTCAQVLKRSLNFQHPNHDYESTTESTGAHRRWHWRNGIVREHNKLVLLLMYELILWKRSTITYDTLVRGGIVATSAYVSASIPAASIDPTATPSAASETTTTGGQGQVTLVNPPTAKCSRGVRIMPDIYFEPSGHGFGPVRVSFSSVEEIKGIYLYIIGQVRFTSHSRWRERWRNDVERRWCSKTRKGLFGSRKVCRYDLRWYVYTVNLLFLFWLEWRTNDLCGCFQGVWLRRLQVFHLSHSHPTQVWKANLNNRSSTLNNQLSSLESSLRGKQKNLLSLSLTELHSYCLTSLLT